MHTAFFVFILSNLNSVPMTLHYHTLLKNEIKMTGEENIFS